LSPNGGFTVQEIVGAGDRMSSRRFRFVALFCALPLVAGRAEPATPVAGVAPLPPEEARHFAELLRAAEEYRGLKAKGPVTAGSLSLAALKAQMTQLTAPAGEDAPALDLPALEAGLKAFDLIPETMDLGRYLPELMSTQVAGYYDPNRKYLALVDPPSAEPAKEGKEEKKGAPPPAAKEGAGAAVNGGGGDAGEGERKLESNRTMVHELTHALQDQSFDLRRLLSDHDLMSDVRMSRKALVEGDATLTELDYNFRMGLETLPGLGEILAGLMAEPQKLIERSPDLPGVRQMMAAPAWIRDTLLFSYLQGAAFCMEVRQQGGQALLDYAFATDPPRSTAQILHPEKWYGRRSDPVILHLPDLGADLPGYRKTAEGTLGELSLRIYLREGLHDAAWAADAAAGWTGDRFAVYQKGGARRVFWMSEWANGLEAGQFKHALDSVGGWRTSTFGPLQVLAVRDSRGPLPEASFLELRARFKEVVAERPANRSLNLAALGAAPQPPDPRAFANLRGGIEMLDEIRKVLPDGAPAGRVSPDGRSYLNPALGISIRLPDSLQGWRLERDPVNPQVLVTMSSPDGAVRIGVGYQIRPADTASSLMSRMVERAVQSTMTEFHRLDELEHDQAVVEMREISFVALLKGQQVRGELRTLARDSDFFFLTALGPSASWPREQATALRVLNSFRVGAKSAP
jgi:hypothetical protein